MLWEGEVLQMIQELKQALPKVTDSDKAWKQINYFTNNQERMDYARYRAASSLAGRSAAAWSKDSASSSSVGASRATA